MPGLLDMLDTTPQGPNRPTTFKASDFDEGGSMAGDFLSEPDRVLHRTVFPRGYSVALVVNLITAAEHTYSLFGWREGLLQTRGFHRLSAPPPITRMASNRRTR